MCVRVCVCVCVCVGGGGGVLWVDKKALDGENPGSVRRKMKE